MKKISESNESVYIIAEIGVNHNGSIDLAKKLILEAKQAGVDAVKFQTYNANNLLANRKISKAPYQSRDKSDNQYDMLKKLELSFQSFKQLKKYCDTIEIDFLSTPYDRESLDFLIDLGVSTIKFASADLVNKYLLDYAIEKEVNLILSTGMASYDEIRRTISYIKNKKKTFDIALLHCTTSYPTPYYDVNMNVIKVLLNDYGEELTIGYSDHTQGIEIPVMAVSMGAKVIEKHFTLNRTMDGPDHFASIEPHELKAMVNSIRNVEKAFGNYEKKLSDDEQLNIQSMRRSIHAKKDLNIGDILTEENISISRPNDGISPWKYKDILGRECISTIDHGKAIKEDDIK